MQNDAELAKTYHLLKPEQKIEFLKNLSPEAFDYFRYYSDLMLRPKQIVQDGDWRYYIAQCGRGWGKSKMGAHWLASKVYKNISGLALVAPTHSDIEDYIKDALESEFPPNKKPRYVAGDKKKFICFNGIEIKAYSSDKLIRGANISYIWLDEFCFWNEAKEKTATERFKTLDYAVRKNKAQFLITTTPQNWSILNDWNDRFSNNDPLIRFVYGETKENTDLPPQVIEKLYKEYGNTRNGRCELLGIINKDTPGALWTQSMIEKAQYKGNIEDLIFDKIIIAVDPAVSVSDNSDETGIIVAGKYNGNVYIIADHSGKYTPEQWGRKVNDLYKEYQANYIVCEINMGGDLVKANLRLFDHYLPIKEIRASKGKLLRAEPVAAAYEQGKVFHIGILSELERQMTTYTADTSESPDRLDCCVYCVSELLLNLSGKNGLDTRNLPYF